MPLPPPSEPFPVPHLLVQFLFGYLEFFRGNVEFPEEIPSASLVAISAKSWCVAVQLRVNAMYLSARKTRLRSCFAKFAWTIKPFSHLGKDLTTSSKLSAHLQLAWSNGRFDNLFSPQSSSNPQDASGR